MTKMRPVNKMKFIILAGLASAILTQGLLNILLIVKFPEQTNFEDHLLASLFYVSTSLFVALAAVFTAIPQPVEVEEGGTEVKMGNPS